MKWMLLIVALAGCGGDDDPTLTAEQLRDPQTCKKCHPDQFKEWSGSMHAYASDDPVFLAMNRKGQADTQGQLADFCLKCHAPMAVAMGATQNGLNLDSVPAELKGVTCYYCHAVDAVNGTHNNPLHVDTGSTTMRGEYRDAIKNGAHHSQYSTLHDYFQADSSSMCGSCHDIVTPHGAAIERTFQEWQSSVFSHMTGQTCAGCHMSQTQMTTIADFKGVPGNRTRFSHLWPAVDTALIPFPADNPQNDVQKQAVADFMHNELASALCVADFLDGTSAIRVLVDNLAAGHGFPSGSAQDRRMWVEIKAFDTAGTMFFSSGVVPDGQPPTMNPDPNLWLIRDCMLDQNGQPASMFWNAYSVDLIQGTDCGSAPGSYLLPPQLANMITDCHYFWSHIKQYYPKDKTMHLSQIPNRVEMRIRLQPIGLDVLDELVADSTAALDPAIRASMPTFDLDTDQSVMTPTPTLVWTKADDMNGAHIGPYEDAGMTQPDYCVTHVPPSFVVATFIDAPRHTACSP